MQFGYFDDEAREYVITTPETPLPWINYLGNEDFFRLISNSGGGYCFYKDAKLRRITRFRYNNVPADQGGHFYYIADGDMIWNPGFAPTGTELERYRCRHGMGYTVFEAEKAGVQAELTCFVPMHETCEIDRMILRNHSREKKTLRLYSAVEWCLWNAIDDAQNFQRNLNIAEVEVDGSTLYHKTEYRERRSHFAFFHVNTPISGYETDRDTFLGLHNHWSRPAVITSGKSENSLASGWYPMASHRIDVELEPGEEKTFLFLLGYCENPAGQKWERKGVLNKDLARRLIEMFATEEAVKRALDELAVYWDTLLSRFQVRSGDEKLDRMVNIWNQYQCMITFNMSRSASYFESGTGRGMGFRDSCQDLLGFVHMVPERARERILDIAAIQFEDGSTYHQYQPLTKTGNADVGSGFNDDPLWLVACTAAYIRETGDASILNEPVRFNTQPGTEQPLFEHLRRSVNFTVGHKGPHGLPLIGRADWNDCLNLNCFSEEPGESFQTVTNFESGKAESVLIAGMFVKYGREYGELCERFGDSAEAASILREVGDMERVILQHGWDGEWFLRAYDAFGNKVGSHECEEGQIFIEPQGFCVMAGVGKAEGLAEKALSSVRRRLTNDFGIELVTPPYTEYQLALGEITSYPPGYKENGSVFCHNNPWVCLAYTELGDGDQAFDVYRRHSPAYIEPVSEIHRTEPYVYSQTIAGRYARNYGEAKNSWLTGTAAWSLVAATQGILGICPDFDGLRIKPCLPSTMDSFSSERKYRSVTYSITVRKSADGTKKMLVDGQPVKGDLVPYDSRKEHCQVEVFC